ILLKINNDTLRIDIPRAQAFVNDRLLDVTSMEFEILLALGKTPSEVLSREELLQRCNGSNAIYSRGIVALVYRLRNKIRAAGAQVDFIRTVRSRGYAVVGYVNSL
ncbi:winged helix-turn-helix transcriptional regulator, partial [Raoultella ornithinolytica]|nr:winged helix-turn-helix transcriptional regulator [Raoultella ornithinolytica]